MNKCLSFPYQAADISGSGFFHSFWRSTKQPVDDGNFYPSPGSFLKNNTLQEKNNFHISLTNHTIHIICLGKMKFEQVTIDPKQPEPLQNNSLLASTPEHCFQCREHNHLLETSAPTWLWIVDRSLRVCTCT